MSHVQINSSDEQQLQEHTHNIDKLKNMIADFKDLNTNTDMDIILTLSYYYAYKIGHKNGYNSALNGMLDL